MRTFALLLCAVVLSGCSSGKAIVKAQAPGQATGAGASITGPANSAAPSTQRAVRQTVYQPAPVPVAAQTQPEAYMPASQPAPAPQATQTPPIAFPVAPPPAPAWTYEQTETSFGQHQDAAGIMQMAAAVNKWGWLRWVGVLCILAGVAGWLWSVGNPAGFPLVFMGLAACGVIFLLASSNPAWLLVLLLPVGLWAVQHMNLLKLPPP